VKIISKFHDYYDGAAANFYDENLYMRKHQYIENFKKVDVGTMIPIKGSKIYSSRVGVLGFCGRLYPFHTIKKLGSNFFDRPTMYTLYSAEEVIDVYKKSGYDHHNFESITENFFIDYSHNDHIKDLFEKFDTPVFVYYGKYNDRNLSINPILKSYSEAMSYRFNCNGDMFYDFHNIVDPYTAAQELDMFISNNLAYEKKLPLEVSDKVKAVKYGHDGKYSFKKEPQRSKV